MKTIFLACALLISVTTSAETELQVETSEIGEEVFYHSNIIDIKKAKIKGIGKESYFISFSGEDLLEVSMNEVASQKGCFKTFYGRELPEYCVGNKIHTYVYLEDGKVRIINGSIVGVYKANFEDQVIIKYDGAKYLVSRRIDSFKDGHYKR